MLINARMGTNTTNHIEFIEDHLGEEINIENLAKIASLSPFYYQHLFSRLVKKPVAEYVKLRRMAKATEGLASKEISAF